MSSSHSGGYWALFKEHYGLLGIAFLAMFTGNLGQSFFIGLFQSDISHSLGLSLAQFGSLYASITIAGGLLMLHFGGKIDWVAPKTYAALVLAGLSFGLLLLTLSPWLSLGLLGLAILRFTGQGLMTHIAGTLAAREFDRHRGKALGIVSLGMPLGEILLPPMIALLAISYSWQQIWWVILAVIVGLWGVAFSLASWPAAPQSKHTAKAQQHSMVHPFRELRFWLLMPLLMAMPMTLTGIFIFQAQLTHDFGSHLTTYALALMAMGIMRFPGALFGGKWLDQFGLILFARCFLLPFALALALSALLSGDWGIWILLVGAGITLGMQSPLGDSLLVHVWGREYLGRVRAAKSALMVFSTGISPALIGALLHAGVSFQMVLWGMLGFIVLALSLALKPIQRIAHS